MMSGLPYWERKALHEMSREEWEGLCDGCGKCCLIKLEDEDTSLVHYTSVVCQYLDQAKCRCTVYETRRKLVPTCVVLQPDELDALHWMPSTCAYRLLHEGRKLPVWHPLITGNRRAMAASGNSITPGRVISEEFVHDEDLEDHIVEWPR
jgi:uncharacterized cysteine cluster protein YcgN (CxxCxxCC family)